VQTKRVREGSPLVPRHEHRALEDSRAATRGAGVAGEARLYRLLALARECFEMALPLPLPGLGQGLPRVESQTQRQHQQQHADRVDAADRPIPPGEHGGPGRQHQHDGQEHEHAEHVAHPPREPMRDQHVAGQFAEGMQRSDTRSGRHQAGQRSRQEQQRADARQAAQSDGRAEPSPDQGKTCHRLRGRSRGNAGGDRKRLKAGQLAGRMPHRQIQHQGADEYARRELPPVHEQVADDQSGGRPEDGGIARRKRQRQPELAGEEVQRREQRDFGEIRRHRDLLDRESQVLDLFLGLL
jgi:hypothetical protein